MVTEMLIHIKKISFKMPAHELCRYFWGFPPELRFGGLSLLAGVEKSNKEKMH
jgi:hypothetical protein